MQGFPYIYKQFCLSRNTSDMLQYGQKKPAYNKLTVMINDSNSSLAYVYWTVHHLYSCVKRKNQLDATYFII